MSFVNKNLKDKGEVEKQVLRGRAVHSLALRRAIPKPMWWTSIEACAVGDGDAKFPDAKFCGEEEEVEGKGGRELQPNFANFKMMPNLVGRKFPDCPIF